MHIADVGSGPVPARLVRVVDGDTLLVDAMPWPQQSVRVYVRLRGIDAPELHSRCAATRDKARQAMGRLADLVDGSANLRLRDIAGGKYFGRVLASVETPDGVNLSSSMIASRLVAAYSGGRRHAPPCETVAAADR